MNAEKCFHCGLVEGHANRCYVDVLFFRLHALEYIAERAEMLLEAPTDQLKLAAQVKLRHALQKLRIIDRRSKERKTS